MKKNKDNYIYIFLHPPRSGGESLTKFFEENLSPAETIRVDTNKLSDKTDDEKRKIIFLSGHSAYFGIHKKISHKKPRYITIIRDPAEWLVSLYHSRMQNFPEDKKQPFEKWYSFQKRNDLTLYFDETFRSTDDKIVFFHFIKQKLREILDKIDKTRTIHTFLKRLRRKQIPKDAQKIKLQNAKKLLDECWFVCITERVIKDLKFLFKLIGIKADWKNYKVLSNIPRKLFVLDKKTKEKIYRENPLDLDLYKYALRLNKIKKKKLTAYLK